jgi:hypothetical protein
MVITGIENLGKRREWWLLTMALCGRHAKGATSYDVLV